MVCASGAPGRQGVEKPDREQCRVRRCSSSLVHQTRRVQQVPVRVVAPFAHRERRRVFDELFGGGSGCSSAGRRRGRVRRCRSGPASRSRAGGPCGCPLRRASAVDQNTDRHLANGERACSRTRREISATRVGSPGSSPSTITAMSMSLTAATKPSCARLPIRYADTSRGPNTVRAAATASLATSRPCCSSAQLAR